MVVTGGFCGTLLRYWIGTGPRASDAFAYSTFAINLLGSGLLGALVVLATRHATPAATRLRLLLGTGLLGGFTTYSTFALEASLSARDGHAGLATVYIVLSVVGGIAAALAGMAAATRIAR